MATGLFQSANALSSVGQPNARRPSNNRTTSAGTDLLNTPDAYPSPSYGSGGGKVNNTREPSHTAMSSDPLASASAAAAEPHTTTPRRQHSHRASYDLRSLPSNAPPLNYQYTPTHQQSQQQSYQPSPNKYSSQPPPSFNLHQASPNTLPQPANTVPSSANLPSSLQVQTGARAPASSAYTASGAGASNSNMQPHHIQTNAQAYTSQPPSRQGTSHSHSLSSPAGMDGLSSTGQKYIPFNQTPTQTPSSSNPKAYNALSSGTPAVGPSHSPLNLTDIRSRTISDANEPAMGTNMLFNYPDTASNSNYLAPFPTYAFDWCKWPVQGGGSSAGKMAVGSYLEDPHNFIQILDTQITPQEVTAHGQSPYGLEYNKVAEATCAYPVTRILWEPPSSAKAGTDLLATSGDHLRLWSLPQSNSSTSNNINRSSTVNTRDPAPQKLQPLALLSNSKTPEHTAPLTSLDWNRLSPKLIITSSIDTTCTIWDIPTLTAKTQLIAHDKEVFDVRFCAGSVDVFVSCGADGSVRMFDLRSLEHSTIIYEPAEKNDKCKPDHYHYSRSSSRTDILTANSPSGSSPSKSSAAMTPAQPLLRLAASPHDAHLLATFASDSNLIRILDVRQPGTALLELRGHQGNLNTLEWSPNRRGLLASGADDSTVLVWDLVNSANQASLPVNGNGSGGQGEVQAKGPSASWRCDYEVANVSWAPESMLSGQGGDWLGVCAGRGVWGVKL